MTKTALKEAELKNKHDKDALKQKALDAARLNKERQLKLAAHAARALSGLWHSGSEGKVWDRVGKHAMDKADKGTKLKAVGKTCPFFFEMDRSLMRDVSLKVGHCEGKKKVAHVPVFASEAFSAVLFRGSQEKCKDPNPRNCLRQLISATMPRYHALMPGEFHADDLLANNKHCVDKAFLEAVWRYTLSLGKRFDENFGDNFDAAAALLSLPQESSGSASSATGSSADPASVGSGAATSTTAATAS